MTFIVDLLNSSDEVVGDGPLHNVLSVSITEALDEAGQVTFTLPATDYRVAAYIDSATRFRVKFSSSQTAYGLIDSDTLDAVRDDPARTVGGPDLLGELAHLSCGWWCFFDNDDLNADIFPALLADTGWSAGTIDAGLGDFYGRFDGESRLAAFLKILQQMPDGVHLRMGSTLRTLDIGAFGTLSSVRFSNVAHALRAQDATADIAIISALQVISNRSPVVNRIIPWGAGNDDGNINRAKVKLFHLNGADSRWANIRAKAGLRGSMATVSEVDPSGEIYYVDSLDGFLTWPIQQLLWCLDPDDLTAGFGYDFVVDDLVAADPPTPPLVYVRGSPTIPTAPASFPAYLIGNPQLYLQDDTAWAADPREAVVVFNEITLTDLSTGEWERGALQLYNRATRYLATHKVPQRTYQLSVIRVPDTLRVGDKVQVVYRGVAQRAGVPYSWLDLDEELYILKITRTYNADGSTSASIDVSNIDAQPVDDTTVVFDTANQTRSIAVAAS